MREAAMSFRPTCAERGWVAKASAPPSEITHLLLDGGKMSVPAGDEGDFINLLARVLVRGDLCCCVGCRAGDDL